jgi:hypothetical protein
MTSSFFELWVKTVFFLTVEWRHENLAYNGNELLLLNGLESHHTLKFEADGATRNIEILPLIPHAFDQI